MDLISPLHGLIPSYCSRIPHSRPARSYLELNMTAYPAVFLCLMSEGREVFQQVCVFVYVLVSPINFVYFVSSLLHYIFGDFLSLTSTSFYCSDRLEWSYLMTIGWTSNILKTNIQHFQHKWHCLEFVTRTSKPWCTRRVMRHTLTTSYFVSPSSYASYLRVLCR